MGVLPKELMDDGDEDLLDPSQRLLFDAYKEEMIRKGEKDSESKDETSLFSFFLWGAGNKQAEKEALQQKTLAKQNSISKVIYLMYIYVYILFLSTFLN
jgi:hypothetical protein